MGLVDVIGSQSTTRPFRDLESENRVCWPFRPFDASTMRLRERLRGGVLAVIHVRETARI